MPFYRITVTDIYGKISQGIREDPMTDINAYYGKAHRKAEIALKNRLRSVDVVMLMPNSKEVLESLEKRRNNTSVVYDPNKAKEILDKGRGDMKYDQYLPPLQLEK